MKPIAEAESSGKNKTGRRRTGIYKDYNARQESWCVYFYYVTDRSGYDEVKCFCLDSDRKITSIKIKIKQLLENVFEQTDTPPQCGSNFRSFKWRRYSYIVIALDSENVVFDRLNALTVKHESSKLNHSFFDGNDYTQKIEVQGVERNISVVYFINHMVGLDGYEIMNGQKEKFDFHWNLIKKSRVPFLPPDSGGTNQGGPAAPPYRKKTRKKATG
jgi:hypothetical protein